MDIKSEMMKNIAYNGPDYNGDNDYHVLNNYDESLDI